MIVVKRNPIPLYEVECYECKSIIHYQASEVDTWKHITCPVCRVEIPIWSCYPVDMEVEDD